MPEKILKAAGGLVLVALPFIVRNDYYLHLMNCIFMYSMLGMGFSIMWKNRLITCGQAGFWAVGAYTSTLLVMNAGVPFWLALLAAGIASALVALLTLSIALKAGPLQFFAITLVISFIIMQVLGVVEFFGGWHGIFGIPRPTIGSFVFLSKTSYYYLALFLLSANVFIFYALYRSRIGRAWTAIGLSASLAEMQGIDVYRYRLAATVIGCFFAGICGSFYAHYQTVLVPTTFSFQCSIFAQMYALIGGLSYYIAGPIAGAAVMVLLPELLRPVAEFQPIIYGVLLILIVVFLPRGILSIPQRFPVVRGFAQIGAKLKGLPISIKNLRK